VGRIEIDIQDANYLGNLIPSQGALTLGNFIPAYFTVAQVQPTLQNTHEDTFSYIGETIEFVTGSEPLLIFTAKNVQNAVTENYGVTPWILSLSQLDVNNGIFLIDSSTYAKTDSAEEVSKGSTPIISTGNLDYDGIIEVQIPDTRFKYNKVRSDNTTFDIASPFTAFIDMEFSSTFLTDTDDVCYQADYASGTCLPFTITSITGANMRYGRLALESTYGPETEPLRVPIKAEYYDTGRWLLNTDDSGTSIAFNQSTDHIKLLASGSADITSDINNISSTGSLLLGVADDSNDLLLNAPGDMGAVKLQLDPSNDPTGWSDYLNYDWNGDGVIDSDDHPEATVTFGQFRGNDRIIHWREVFN
jgi:MSHA biogenesis protein MshQ